MNSLLRILYHSNLVIINVLRALNLFATFVLSLVVFYVRSMIVGVLWSERVAT